MARVLRTTWRTLGSDAAAGLYAELIVLRDVLAPAIGMAASVDHWTGPDPGLQDFQFGRGALEVKSYRGTGSGHLEISSERQLDDAGSAALFLAYVELDQRTDGTGTTLRELVTDVRASAAPLRASELETKLRHAGWDDDCAPTHEERYSVRTLELFAVREGFPRIVPADLPPGIGKVRYRIDRSALQPYACTQEAVTATLGPRP